MTEPSGTGCSFSGASTYDGLCSVLCASRALALVGMTRAQSATKFMWSKYNLCMGGGINLRTFNGAFFLAVPTVPLTYLKA